MSRRKKTGNNKGFSRNQKNNFQDKAEVKEYNKGMRAGENRADDRYPISGLTSSDNDPSFYIPNGQMAKDVLSLPETIGSGIPITIRNDSKVQAPLQKMVVPGIMVYNVVDTIPAGTGGIDSPINRAGSDLYQAIQAANSRPPKYGMPSLMMYLIAHTSLLGLYEYLCRAFGTANRGYSYMDIYTPQALVESMRINYKSLKGDMANARTQLNQLAQAMSSLVIPSAFKYIERQVWLYAGIYTDSDTAKAQYYLYNPVGFFQWIEGKQADPAGQTGLTYLEFNSLDSLLPNGVASTDLLEFTDLVDYGWTLLNNLRNSEDIRNIGADLIKAFGMGKMYKVNPIAETFAVIPSYSKEVLAQMENAYIYPSLVYNLPAQKSVTQYVIQNPGITSGGIGAETLELYDLTLNIQEGALWNNVTDAKTGKFIWQQMQPDQYLLNFHQQQVDSELLLTSSRFTTATPILPKEGSDLNAFTMQPEVTAFIAGVDCYVYQPNDDTNSASSLELTHITFESINFLSAGASPQVEQYLYIPQMWSIFDWMPKIECIPYYKIEDAYVTNVPTTFMWDLDNYYMMGSNLLHNVNYMANVGLFQPKGLPGTSDF